MYAISFINWKGGVGKTTISTSIAYLLAKEGYRVLFIDSDKQGNASRRLGAPRDCPGLAELFLEKRSASELIIHTRYAGIDLIAGSPALLDANLSVLRDTDEDQTTILSSALREIDDQYDFCITDNPPDSNIMVLNNLVLSDAVIAVSTLSQDSFDGIEYLRNEIENYNSILGTSISISGVLINMYKKSAENEHQIKSLADNGFRVFGTRIRNTIKTAAYLQQASNEQKVIFEISPKCGFAADITAFVYSLFKEDE